MRGFKFRYAKLLKLRRDEEEDRKLELANKIADRRRIRDKLDLTLDERKKYEEKIAEEMKRGVGASRVATYNASKRWYREEIEKLEEMLRLAEIEVEKARNEVILAMQEVKKIEKLEEKAIAEYKFEEEKKMANNIEEVVNFNTYKK